MAGKNTQITVAVISLLGVLGTALIANWDKMFPTNESKPNPITQNGTKPVDRAANEPETKPETDPAGRGEPEAQESIYIQKINTSSPDYVDLGNKSSTEANIGGYQIKEDNNTFDIPNGTIIPGNGTRRIYFFSRKKRKNAALAQAHRAKGHIVCAEFGLSQGETIRLVDPKGKLLSKK